jgi:putative DNA primase/helicase
VLARFLPEQPSTTPAEAAAPAMRPVDLDDQELLEKAFQAKNGDRFHALWNGDTSAYDGDDSRADLALCGMLAFWTGRDAGRMDSMFRTSGLMRTKWDRRSGETTYGMRTIEAAISGVRGGVRGIHPERHPHPERGSIRNPSRPGRIRDGLRVRPIGGRWES